MCVISKQEQPERSAPLCSTARCLLPGHLATFTPSRFPHNNDLKRVLGSQELLASCSQLCLIQGGMSAWTATLGHELGGARSLLLHAAASLVYVRAAGQHTPARKGRKPEPGNLCEARARKAVQLGSLCKSRSELSFLLLAGGRTPCFS